MKKVYIIPHNQIISLDAEDMILSMSVSGEVSDAVGTQKKDEGSIWTDECNSSGDIWK